MAQHFNNFDLIRLAAASQVMVIHSIHNLGIETSRALETLEFVLSLFPGVPIFFVISGYLVSASYERAGTLLRYAQNRFLRIYPALVACTILSLFAFLTLGRMAEVSGGISVPLAKWLVAQLTIFQYYVPASLKAAYGVGHWNGSLWTIPVEMQFYAVLPLIYLAVRGSRTRERWTLSALLLVSYLASLTLGYGEAAQGTRWEGGFSLWRTSVLPYLYMFLLGVLAQRHRAALAPWFEGRAAAWLLTYLLLSLALKITAGVEPGSNNPHPFNMLALAGLTLSGAHTLPMLSNRLLRGNDVSYGVYIYHMVIVNILWELGFGGSSKGLLLAIGLTYGTAYVSWRAVERRALSMKSRVADGRAPSVGH